MPPHPAASQLCPPPPTNHVSAKVELGGLGCGIRVPAGKGGVSLGTAPATALAWAGSQGPGSVPHFCPALTLNPSSIPGSPTAPGRPAPLPVVLHPTPPHPTLRSRETGKRGVE